MKTFMIADTHFYHTNIIEYAERPFTNTTEMNNTIIQKWNSVVHKKDIVYILGDFAFTGKENIEKLITQLNGYKFLILGNHDRCHSVKWWLERGMNEVSKYPIIYKDFYILSHEPMFMNKHMPYLNIHGHIHQNVLDGNKYLNVGVEQSDYYPVDFEWIKSLSKGEEDV